MHREAAATSKHSLHAGTLDDRGHSLSQTEQNAESFGAPALRNKQLRNSQGIRDDSRYQPQTHPKRSAPFLKNMSST